MRQVHSSYALMDTAPDTHVSTAPPVPGYGWMRYAKAASRNGPFKAPLRRLAQAAAPPLSVLLVVAIVYYDNITAMPVRAPKVLVRQPSLYAPHV